MRDDNVQTPRISLTKAFLMGVLSDSKLSNFQRYQACQVHLFSVNQILAARPQLRNDLEFLSDYNLLMGKLQEFFEASVRDALTPKKGGSDDLQASDSDNTGNAS